MAKRTKYFFDPETLAYTKIPRRKRKTFAYFMIFVVASALFAFLIITILFQSSWLQTPGNKIMARELEYYKTNYKILNKKMDQIESVLVSIEARDNNVYRTYFNAAPIPVEQRKAGFGGVNRYKALEGYDNSELVINTVKRADILTKQLAIQSKSLDQIVKIAKTKEKLFYAIPAIQPMKNEEMSRIASGFGFRNDPFTKARKMHNGMDFSAPIGTPIFATGDGIVTDADNTRSGYGKLIIINHGFGYETYYAHLHDYKVKVGQKVKRGDIIGTCGNTGRSQGPHLHYEVRINDEPVNPINFFYADIKAEDYAKISEIAKQNSQSLD